MNIMNYVFFANTPDTAAEICRDVGAIGQILGVVNTVMTIIYIAVPVILILMGSIDLIKAILQSDDKKMKEAQGMLWKRLAYGALIFLLGVIITFVIDLIGQADYQQCMRDHVETPQFDE